MYEEEENVFKLAIEMLVVDLESHHVGQRRVSEFSRGLYEGQKLALSYLRSAIEISKEGVDPIFTQAIKDAYKKHGKGGGFVEN